METKKNISLDALNENSVTVKIQQYIELNGNELNVGELHAKSYVNSERGRKELVSELGEPYLSSVLAIWGVSPTIVEKLPDEIV